MNDFLFHIRNAVKCLAVEPEDIKLRLYRAAILLAAASGSDQSCVPQKIREDYYAILESLRSKPSKFDGISDYQATIFSKQKRTCAKIAEHIWVLYEQTLQYNAALLLEISSPNH